jgi:hypothetical protein
MADYDVVVVVGAGGGTGLMSCAVFGRIAAANAAGA